MTGSAKEKITIIKPSKKLSFVDFKEMWEYRELLLTFSLRDIKIRYKQTLIGGTWAIMQPFAQMVIFSFFFGKLAKIPSDGIPYPIFSYAGLLLWTFFSNCLSATSNSMVASAAIIKKVYFPRLITPIASTLVYVVDYLIAFTVLLGLMSFYKFSVTISFLLLPLVLFFTWLLALGMGFFLSAVNVKYRDVGLALPFFIQLFMYITPVIYPSSVAGQFQWIVDLNPMSGFIEAHRALILGLPFDIHRMIIPFGFMVVFLILGMFYFRKTEREFVDII